MRESLKGIKSMIKVIDIINKLNARVVCGKDRIEDEIDVAFASDLMSDVLTIDTENMILVTGLSNLQVIRTAEMSDVSYILLVRGKHVQDDMLRLAIDNDMLIIECDYSMFRACGELYKIGVQPVY
jgi:hypothetical protein